MVTYSAGVSVRALRLMTLGSSEWAQGLKVTTWSRWARSKTEPSMVWYLRTLAEERPFSVAVVTQRWISELHLITRGTVPVAEPQLAHPGATLRGGRRTAAGGGPTWHRS